MVTLVAVVVIGSVTALGVAVQGLFVFPAGL
jgi:Flp pilus assembly pilin Flp